MANKKLIPHQTMPDSTRIMIKIMRTNQKNATTQTSLEPLATAKKELTFETIKSKKNNPIAVMKRLKEMLIHVKTTLQETKKKISPEY
ncbi:hypothetical protein DIZ81_02005 [Legionella taurinensis]|uniref:Uncharacterized protein n=1 Tax=Legionella taurinensis TaxID=70611 RepID=A0A3A5LML2_9GAMM|nr:hypothetical protein DB744_02010 [Legionella taurinensis]PUT44683.1 hypothetical protein DB746_02010 [Legionella taurinensis]PUT48003.1 hypothetical protein DB743_00170 [Legionella taurinensis]PUT48816.1 hypothetical protein DB745_02010 [Legionella taurinensis]RJT45886.1 hypothetical protein D6J04_09820 [Legionella taurinensis]